MTEKNPRSENPMTAWVNQIKKSFINPPKGYPPDVTTVFLIGSVANNPGPYPPYQDIDVHFITGWPNLSSLQMVRQAFCGAAATIPAGNEVAAEFNVVDGPWKMIPKAKYNLSIHGTVLNPADLKRRLKVNPFLALNMFGNAESLVGQLPIVNQKISPVELISGIGGTGWLKENFDRLLPIIGSLPPAAVREICYYFGLSPLLQHYYQTTGATATRDVCFKAFQENPAVPADVRVAAGFIKTADTSVRAKDLIAATLKVMGFVHRSAGASTANEPPKEKLTDEGSDILSGLLGRQIKIQQVHCQLADSDHPDRLIAAAGQEFSRITSPTPGDFFSTLSAIVRGEISEANRVYLWTPDNTARAQNQIDFPDQPTVQSWLYGWESGAVTLLQRLSEIYINNGRIGAAEAFLAETVHKYCQQRLGQILGVQPTESKDISGKTPEEKYFCSLKELADLIKSQI